MKDNTIVDLNNIKVKFKNVHGIEIATFRNGLRFELIIENEYNDPITIDRISYRPTLHIERWSPTIGQKFFLSRTKIKENSEVNIFLDFELTYKLIKEINKQLEQSKKIFWSLPLEIFFVEPYLGSELLEFTRAQSTAKSDWEDWDIAKLKPQFLEYMEEKQKLIEKDIEEKKGQILDLISEQQEQAIESLKYSVEITKNLRESLQDIRTASEKLAEFGEHLDNVYKNMPKIEPKK